MFLFSYSCQFLWEAFSPAFLDWSFASSSGSFILSALPFSVSCLRNHHAGSMAVVFEARARQIGEVYQMFIFLLILFQMDYIYSSLGNACREMLTSWSGSWSD